MPTNRPINPENGRPCTSKLCRRFLHKRTRQKFGCSLQSVSKSPHRVTTANSEISFINGDFFFRGATSPPVGQSLLFIEASRLHSGTLHSIGILDERSVQRRCLYLTTCDTHKTDIHNIGGIRTRNPSKGAAANLRLKPRGH